MGKNSKSRNIVTLRQMLRRRRIRAMGSSSPSPLPIDVPAGHVAVYVGRWSRKFVMKATHLNHPAFLNLLRQAEKEYGFSQPGPLCLPCDESVFLQTLRQISPSYAFRFAIAEDLDFPVSRFLCCCRARSKSSLLADDALPLLLGFQRNRSGEPPES